MIELAKYKRIKENEEITEVLVPFSLYKEDVLCLYKNKGNVFIVTSQGFMNKVPYGLKELQEVLGL